MVARTSNIVDPSSGLLVSACKNGLKIECDVKNVIMNSTGNVCEWMYDDMNGNALLSGIRSPSFIMGNKTLLNSQRTAHSSLTRASYGVSVVNDRSAFSSVNDVKCNEDCSECECGAECEQSTKYKTHADVTKALTKSLTLRHTFATHKKIPTSITGSIFNLALLKKKKYNLIG